MTAPPVKRGPGRPRKHPLPEPAPDAAAPVQPGPVAAKSDDPRIGMEVHPTATHVGFDDGTQYLAENGVITARAQ